MSFFERIVGDLKSIDRPKTIKLNLMRIVASGFVWGTVMFFQTGDIIFIFVFPLSIAMALGIGFIARALALMRVPFAGIVEIMMRVMVMAGDPLLRIVLQLWGEKLDMPYVTPWFSFSLIGVIDKEEGFSTPDELLKAALNKGRQSVRNLGKGDR